MYEEGAKTARAKLGVLQVAVHGGGDVRFPDPGLSDTLGSLFGTFKAKPQTREWLGQGP